MTFKSGDIVRLNSGGPIMTVVRVEVEHHDPTLTSPEARAYEQMFNLNRAGLVLCRWFDPQGNLKSEHFEPETLMNLNVQ